MAVVVGILFIVAGLWGLNRWFPEFILMMKGLAPLFLLMSGVVALVVGVGTAVSRRNNGKPKT